MWIIRHHKFGRSFRLPPRKARVSGFPVLFRRHKVSAILDPGLDSSVPEKPATVLLFEDPKIYKSSSWRPFFEDRIPEYYGMSFASVTFPDEYSFDQILDELKNDLSMIPDAVLISRGPLSSWFAQSYLESLPLQGLVVFDPVLLDRMHDDFTMEEITEWEHSMLSESHPEDAKTWKVLLEKAKDRKLRLEPNAVPMLVYYTSGSDFRKRAADTVALRHSDEDGLYGTVPQLELPAGEYEPDSIIEDIDAWIDNIL